MFVEQERQPSPWIVYIQIAPGAFLELFPDSQAAPGTIPARDTQASYKHVCLLVDDMSATLSELASRGLEITQAPTVGLDHNLQYWMNDPDGNPIELMQIMADSPQAAADTSAQSRKR
jgi:lactoylglutathione lyase